MNYTTVEDPEEQVQVPLEIDVMSVYQACEQVQDGRHKRGVRDTRGLDLDADRAGQTDGHEHPSGDSGMGALTRQVAQPGAADHAPDVSMCSNL